MVRAPAVLHAAQQIRKHPAHVRHDHAQAGPAVEHPGQDHPEHGDAGVGDEPQQRGEAIGLHGGACDHRHRRMQRHDRAEPFDLGEERVEPLAFQVGAVHVRGEHHAGEAVLMVQPPQLLCRLLRVPQRDGPQGRQPVGMAVAFRRQRLVERPGQSRAVGARQRDVDVAHGQQVDFDAGRVQVAQARVDLRHTRVRGRSPAAFRGHVARQDRALVALRGERLEPVQICGGKVVRMDVDVSRQAMLLPR